MMKMKISLNNGYKINIWIRLLNSIGKIKILKCKWTF